MIAVDVDCPITAALAMLAPPDGPVQADTGTQLAAFAARVRANHGSIDVVAGRSAASRAIGEYLYRRFRSHRVVAGPDPRLSAMPWRDGGVLIRTGSVRDVEPAALSYAVCGIAETGTTVLATGRGNPASNTFLSEDHIVLLDAADLQPDYEAAWTALRRRFGSAWPRGLHFVSGPSSTADIGGQLVQGAHGPLHWHIVLMTDLS